MQLRVLITGGSGVLGRAAAPHLSRAGHRITAPTHHEVDLFDRDAVARAVADTGAILHLATRIPAKDAQDRADAWHENDDLRREATGILVDAALASGVERFVFPSIAFVYPISGRVDESTPVPDEGPQILRSALDAESHVARFRDGGGRGVVLRLGLLYGPGTGSEIPAERFVKFGATLPIEDAGSAIAAALNAPSGVYNVVSDGERVSNGKFKEATGWRPTTAS